MPKRKTLGHTLLAISLCGLIACASTETGPLGDTDSLSSLVTMGGTRISPTGKPRQLNGIRKMAIQETALSLGAQSGLAYRAEQIDTHLAQQTSYLDKIYNFNALLLEHNVLPPVLLEGRNTLNLANASTIRISDRSYKIIKQARFVTATPNWRQYLWMDYQKPERPNATLLPKNKQEQEVWDAYVTQGWNNGIQQANSIFSDRLARIKSDIEGMVRYRKLLAQNMVSPPYVSHTDLGVTGDNSEIHIDDKVLRITALPALNPNASEWRAAVSKEEDPLKTPRKHAKSGRKSTIVISDKAWQPALPSVHY